MLFTLVIWIFSFLSLLLAAMFFVFFLWSYIPREDGGLSGFCERKVNKRLKQIVSIKINKAMAEEERKRKKAELKAAKKNGGDRPMTMKPSLPVLGDDNLAEMPSMHARELRDERSWPKAAHAAAVRNQRDHGKPVLGPDLAPWRRRRDGHDSLRIAHADSAAGRARWLPTGAHRDFIDQQELRACAPTPPADGLERLVTARLHSQSSNFCVGPHAISSAASLVAGWVLQQLPRARPEPAQVALPRR
jgi:hypothetical protein